MGKSVESLTESLGLDIEEIVGDLGRRIRIGTATVSLDVAEVAIRLRILFGADKEHMFEEVGETRSIQRIIKTAAINRKRRCCLVGLRIRYQQHFEAVGKHQVAVVPGIIRALDDVITGNSFGGRCLADRVTDTSAEQSCQARNE